MKMHFFRRMTAVGAAVVIMVGLCGASPAFAAKAKPKVAVSGKMSVPAGLIKGSLVTKGRVFYKTSLPENALASIRLGRQAQDILKVWGNPTRITPGSAIAEVPTQPQLGPVPYTPSGGGLPGIEPLPGLPGMPGQPQQQQNQTLSMDEVTWTYDLPNGITLEFIITEGIITQITVGGVGPWSLSKTRTGIQLGDTYKLAIWVCGYPEKQVTVGRFLRLEYSNKRRAIFTFLNNKVVGITIAMVPSELKL